MDITEFHTAMQAARTSNLSIEIDSPIISQAAQMVATPADRPAEIDQVISALNVELKGIEADQAKRIATAKATLGKGDKDKFVAEMNASREAAKKQMHAALDRAYDKLKAIGDKHPEARPAIAQAAAEAQGLLNGAVKGITDTVATVISTIGEGLEDAGKAIVGVVSKVGEGIKSIFSGW